MPFKQLCKVVLNLSHDDETRTYWSAVDKEKNYTGTGGAVCKGATPSVEQLGGRGFKPRLQSLRD